MLEAVAIKLVSVLAGYLFEQALISQGQVKIDGAPGWYYKETSKKDMYAFSYLEGGYEVVEEMEKRLQDKMGQKVEDMIAVILKKEFADVQNPLERELLDRFRDDKDLPLFIRENLKIEKIEYVEPRKGAPGRCFAGATLSMQVLFDYQKDRIEKIRYEISHHRADRGFEELDSNASEKQRSVEEKLESVVP